MSSVMVVLGPSRAHGWRVFGFLGGGCVGPRHIKKLGIIQDAEGFAEML